MLADKPILYLARLLIETRTPLSIATGRGDGIFDTLLVRDANGLPAIPGSSFAGVLRSVYQSEYGEQLTNELFGYSEQKDSEQISFVHVSWGCIHNSQNQPIEGLEENPETLKKDTVLADALQLSAVVRDHVRLNHRGTAIDQGKFDRTSLRMGHRFSLELSLWSDNAKDERWNKLLNLLARPDFRLGGATRRGLGALKVTVSERQFNLKDPKDFADYNSPNFSLDLGNTDGFMPKELSQDHSFPQVKISITPQNGYRFGQGIEAFGIEDTKLLPVSERIVKWENNQGKVSTNRRLLIPGSAVKGALSHRIAFHYNALNNFFADQISETELENYDKDDNDAVKGLFGFLKDKQGGQIGHVLLDDLFLRCNAQQAVNLQHNSVDRFTGGVREGMLFNEEVITHESPLELTLTVINTHQHAFDANVRKALDKTLKDLVEGRLALGAGSGRGGYGYFTGQLTW
ncbi:MAG: hypothetical protein KAI17_25985, partial [Thiotrichaceae bacterium]|nr:hypothetical protein [Thiotrichaceae bacterium]